MEDVKKWTVTYTKHLKQKRKVYQDGFLHVHSSTRKVMLYDDSETLLVSRFVKTDDIVRSGETVTFATYLVDIGDRHGDLKPSTDSTSKGADVQLNNDKARSLHGHSFKTNLSSTGRKTTGLGIKIAPSTNLSPSQKVIREFKKNEFGKYRTSPTCPDTTKTSITEWQVLYTTQLTQKAKTFHDGILKVAVNGLQGIQAMLYDSKKMLLDSKFLKRHELVRSGETLTFDGHLVEIGECEGQHKPSQDSNTQAINCNLVEKTGIKDGVEGQTQYNLPVEWEAMYTTQVTQKAKKYHSGILRLVSCGSYRMQAILLGEDGMTLSRKYLEVSKEVSSGSTLELPGYLVEVGEPRKSPGREPQGDISQYKDKEANVSTSGANSIIPSRRPGARKLLHGNLENKTSTPNGNKPCARSSGADAVRSSERLHTDKPLLNGNFEKKISAPNDKKPCIRSSEDDALRSSESLSTDKPLRNAQSILSILKKPITREGNTTIKKEAVDPDEESEMDVEADEMVNCIDLNLRSEVVLNNHSVEPISMSDSQPIIHNSTSLSFGQKDYIIEVPNLESSSEAPHISRPVDEKSTITKPRVLDALIVDADGLEVISSTANANQNSGVSSEEAKRQKKLQVSSAEDKNSEEEYIRKEKNNEFPSFDLGF